MEDDAPAGTCRRPGAASPRSLHVADDGGGREEPPLADELALDLEERRLGVVDEHELRRPDAGDLAAELGADRAAGAGDEHDLAREVVGDRREVDLDRLAAEHVLDLDGAQLPREVGVAGDELGEARERLDGHLERARRLDDPGA